MHGVESDGFDCEGCGCCAKEENVDFCGGSRNNGGNEEGPQGVGKVVGCVS